MIDNTTTKDRSEIASENGFTGTFAAFIEWLQASLVYGGVIVRDPVKDERGRTVVHVETVTGGFSSDEALLGRLGRYWWMAHHWVSSQRGGLSVYEFTLEETISDVERVWLEPADGVFERLMRARRVRVYDQTGSYVEFSYDHGAEFLFEERERDLWEPQGFVVVRPAPPVESLFPAVAPRTRS